MEAYLWITLLMVAAGSKVTGYTLNADEKETLISDAVREYVSQIVFELDQKHNVVIQQLRDIIDSQQKDIEDLKSEKILYHSRFSELVDRVEPLESLAAQIEGYKENDVQDEVSEEESSRNDVSGQETAEDVEVTLEKSISASKFGTKSTRNQRRVRRAVGESRVAFSASMTQHEEHLGQGQDLVFDNVITNIGNAYNENHGTFLAPVPGVYLFYFSLHSPGARADLVVNGSAVAYLYIGNDQASQMAIVYLSQGDDVSVQNIGSDKMFWGVKYSTFSGFLLLEGSDNNMIVG